MAEIKYLKHHEINLGMWDSCIAGSIHGVVYALSWYLNIVSPGWCAIVWQEKEKYLAVLPLTEKKKFGFRCLYQPLSTQQLGFFYQNEPFGFLEEGLKFIATKFPIIDYQFNYADSKLISGSPLFEVTERKTYWLSLQLSYNQIAEKFSTNHKRNIKKAKNAALKVEALKTSDKLINLFKAEKGNHLKELNENYYRNLQLISEVSEANNAKYACAVFSGDELIAGALFLHWNKRMIYLLGASTMQGKQTGAMHLIFDSVIEKFAGQEILLDFEGGEIEGIGRFFQGFGATTQTYKRIKYDRFGLVRLVNKVKSMLKKKDSD